MVNFEKAPVIDSKLALLLIRTVVDATSDGKAPSKEGSPLAGLNDNDPGSGAIGALLEWSGARRRGRQSLTD